MKLLHVKRVSYVYSGDTAGAKVHGKTFKTTMIGVSSATLAFWATLGLESQVGDTYFALFLTAVALVCWKSGWLAGAISAVSGFLGVAMLLPPTFTLTVDSRADVMRLILYGVISSIVCTISLVAARSDARLKQVEKRSQLSDLWLQAAQKEALLWTWELDLEKSLLNWQNPYGEVPSQEFRSFRTWLDSIVPEDKSRFESAMYKAITTGKVHVQYEANTSRGRHHLVTRGVLVAHPDEPEVQRLVGITLDLDGKPVSSEPPAVQNGPVSQLVLALIGLSDLLGSIEQHGRLDQTTRIELAKAREEITRMLITERAS